MSTKTTLRLWYRLADFLPQHEPAKDQWAPCRRGSALDKVGYEEIVMPYLPGALTSGPGLLLAFLRPGALAGNVNLNPTRKRSLTNNTYAEIIGQLMRFDKAILTTGGGGYDVEKTVRGWAPAWEAFCCEERVKKADFNLAWEGLCCKAVNGRAGSETARYRFPINNTSRWIPQYSQLWQ